MAHRTEDKQALIEDAIGTAALLDLLLVHAKCPTYRETAKRIRELSGIEVSEPWVSRRVSRLKGELPGQLAPQ